jgi:NAD(P)H dehydrogenase (quinone)
MVYQRNLAWPRHHVKPFLRAPVGVSRGAAERPSEALGRKIVYQAQTPQEARETRSTSRLETFEAERRMLTGHGLDEYEVKVFVTHFTQIAAGDLARVSDAVPRLTGHPAQSLAEYLQSHPESYSYLL